MIFWIVVLALIVAIFGGAGFAVHFLWWVLLVLVLLWLVGLLTGRYR